MPTYPGQVFESNSNKCGGVRRKAVEPNGNGVTPSEFIIPESKITFDLDFKIQIPEARAKLSTNFFPHLYNADNKAYFLS